MSVVRMTKPHSSAPAGNVSARKPSDQELADLCEAAEDIRAGRVISLAEMEAWVESWDTSDELPPPHDHWR